MKHEVLYSGAFALLKAQLEHNEMLKAESDAMVSMSSTVDVEGRMEGGILGGIGRMLAGESFFFQTLNAKRGSGEVLLAPAYPGDIVDVELDGSYSLVIQKDGFLAGSAGVEVSTKVQNMMQGLFSGEGFFILKASGKGTVFVSAYGNIHAINLEAGEERIIDNNHLVAWPDYMQYEVTKASSGWISSFTSGEMLVCKFRGPGVVLIQTKNPKGFGDWIQPLIPNRK